MNFLKNHYPVVLLVSFTILSHFNQPNMASAIFIIPICGLIGYRMYLDKIQLPDIRKEVNEALASRDKVIRDLEITLNSIDFKSKAKTEVKNIRF